MHRSINELIRIIGKLLPTTSLATQDVSYFHMAKVCIIQLNRKLSLCSCKTSLPFPKKPSIYLTNKELFSSLTCFSRLIFQSTINFAFTFKKRENSNQSSDFQANINFFFKFMQNSNAKKLFLIISILEINHFSYLK